jgi:hypothetical protein
MRAAVRHYRNRAQFAARIGVKPATLARYTLPREDVHVGGVLVDGEIVGGIRGWSDDTIDEWNRSRRGRGRRREAS